MGLERWLGVLGGVGVGVALLYYLYGRRPEPEPEPEPAPVEAPAPEAAAGPEFPLPEPSPGTAPPSTPGEGEDLAVTDEAVRQSAVEVFGRDIVEAFLIRTRILQNFVTTVDSLDREPVPLRFRVVSAVPEVPAVIKDGDRLVLSPENEGRYRVLVSAFAATDGKALVALYRRYYPLLERAYRELGYPGRYFNDRLVRIIDHLLAAPEPAGPLELVRPKVLYLFADPALEELSSGRKILVRMGPRNAAQVKDKLREIRALLVPAAPAAP